MYVRNINAAKYHPGLEKPQENDAYVTTYIP